jgi:hypothetical protein
MQPLIRGSPNGVKPTGIAARRPGAPRGARTLGKETSEYQQEEKSIEIPLLAASENGKAQTESLAERHWRCGVRLQRLQPWELPAELGWKAGEQSVILT